MKTLLKKKVLALAPVALLCVVANVFAQSEKTVVIARRGDVIQKSLPSATNFFVKKVVLNQHNKAKIKAQGNFSPQVPYVKFFYGEDASGSLVGTVLFNQMETRHGLIEVGIALTPAGEVSNVMVTKAAAEMEPWVKAVISTGLMKNFIGLSAQSMRDPVKDVSKSELGAMPYYVAQVITAAVIRGVVYYSILFRGRLPG